MNKSQVSYLTKYFMNAASKALGERRPWAPFRTSLSAGALLLLLTSSAAWGQVSSETTPAAWKEIMSNAQKEGRVVLYTVIPAAIMDRLKADFAATNPGIAVEYTRLSSGPILSKLDVESKTGVDGADMHVSSEVTWTEDRAKEGLIKAPVGPNARAWPPAYVLRGIVPILALEPLGIAYNSNEIKLPVTKYQDLLRTEFKGRIGVIPVVSTTMAAFYDWLEKTEGPDFLARLGAQQPKIAASTPAAAQMVASGELGAFGSMSPGNILPLIKLAAPVKMIYPNPAFGFRSVGAIVAWSKRPNAAQVFLDYLMSRRGQAVWTGGGEAASPLPGIAGSLDAKSIVAADVAPFTGEPTKAWEAKWNGIFKR